MERVLAAPTLTASGLVAGPNPPSSSQVYYGYTITTVTATAAINIRRGTVSGQIIDIIPSGTAAGATKSLAHGLQAEGGIYVDFNGASGGVVVHYE
jgi:hypothetical protein